jgi:nitroreductase
MRSSIVMTVTEAVLARRSVRAFLDRPVPRDMVRDIVAIARHAPSSSNMQPWKLAVMTGEDLRTFKAKVRASLLTDPKGEGAEYNVYADPLKGPYDLRRRKCAEDMYASIALSRDDKAGRRQHFARNFEFFGAPVGMILSIDRANGVGQWVDLGLFLQTLLLAAQERGLATCAQAAWAAMPRTIRSHLSLPSEDIVVAGIALGFADARHPINGVDMGRVPTEAIADFRGFGS